MRDQMDKQELLKKRQEELEKKKKKRPGFLATMLMQKQLQGYVHREAKEMASRFVVMKHEAKRAGLHYDLRFKIPGSGNWDSFAVRKGVPTEKGKKVLAVRTTQHTEKEALLTGTIKSGYGAGKLTKVDGGSCIILKYKDSSISIIFKGSKVKGLYHMVSTGVIDKNFDGKQ